MKQKQKQEREKHRKISNKHFGEIPPETVKSYIDIINNEFGGNIPTNLKYILQLSPLKKFLNDNLFVHRTGFNPTDKLKASDFDTFFEQLRAERRAASDNDYFNNFNRCDYKIEDYIDERWQLKTRNRFIQQL